MERVSYHRLARRELNEAAQFYNAESPGLGSAFLDEVERCTQAIVNYPEAGSLTIGSSAADWFSGFPTRSSTRKQDGLRVLAVMNLKRRPMYWVGRE